MSVFFISDLHLHSSRQNTTNRFLQFLKEDAKNAEALYILGDFFEVFVGDDGLDAHDKQVMQFLAEYAARVPTYFMHGNRDFLISDRFLNNAGITLLQDPHLFELYGKRIVLMHGDTLCTKDVQYQRFRCFVRNPIIKWLYLSLPLTLRQKIAGNIRKASISTHSKITKDHSLYEATPEAIEKVFKHLKMDILLHGHTHQPEIENLIIEGRSVQRIVLGDWGPSSTILEYSPMGPTLKTI